MVGETGSEARRGMARWSGTGAQKAIRDGKGVRRRHLFVCMACDHSSRSSWCSLPKRKKMGEWGSRPAGRGGLGGHAERGKGGAERGALEEEGVERDETGPPIHVHVKRRPLVTIPRTRPAQGTGRKGRRSLVTEYMGGLVSSGQTHAATHPSAVDPSPRLMMPERQARKYYVKVTVS